ncbi:Junctophilin-2 [Fasciola gigantica]|uniref:Junctophilin-2 n=1 Tax=Fasciola gigantica TaxID=46835 RepID=A0A504YBS7_FASGI|nr:Junctophilin-2 [Fasciola gigantica]
MTFRTGRFDFNDGGTYVGQWYRGCAHGLGLATGPNGVGEYSGQWDAGFETCGVYVWPSGNVYAGTWSKGKRHGYGQQIRGKWIYQGQFTAGMCGPCGVKAMCNSQSMYEGSWCLNRFEGYGVETCADGSVYAGSWSRGLRQGLGVRRSYIRVPVNSSETETTKKATLDSLLSSILNRNNDKFSNTSTLDSMGDRESDSAQLSQVIQTETHQVYGGFTDCGRVGRALTKRLRRQHSAFELGCPMSPKIPESTTDVEENTEKSPSSLMSSSQKLRAMSFRTKGLTRTPVNIMSSPEKSSAVTEGLSPNRLKAAVGTSEPSASDWITSVEIYAGEWVEDKRTGYGISERSDGYRYIGEWLQNQRHGYGVVHQPDGTQDEGQFQADRITKRLGRRSKLQILRQSKLKDCIEYAVLRATDAAKEAKNKAAKMAQEKAKLARNAAESAENHLLKARNLSQLARDFVRENEPQFHQPGLEWEKKRQSERLSSTRPIGNPAELSPSIGNSEQNAEDKESSICLHENLEDCKTVPTNSEKRYSSEAGENSKFPTASTATELTNQNMDSLRNSDDVRSLYNSDSTTATITSIADSIVATEVGLNEESCAKKSMVGTRPTDVAVERHSVSRSTPATTPEPSRSYSESFEGRSPVRLPAPRISRMDFAQYHDEEVESSQIATPESRRTGSLDLSSCHQRDYNASKEAYSAPDSVNVKRVTSEETPFDLAPTPVVHEITKPTMPNSLSVENQHPPKLGSQPTQDSGYHSIDPSDSRSLPSRWPTHSVLHQTSQKFDELLESELDQVPSANTDNNNSKEMHKKRYDSLFRSTETQWAEFDRPSERLADRARSRPMSCFAYRDSDQTRFSPPIPKRARVRMNGRQNSLVDKRKHLYPKRRFPSENSRAEHGISADLSPGRSSGHFLNLAFEELFLSHIFRVICCDKVILSGPQSFGVTESLHSQTPYHDARCLQYQRPHSVRVPKEPLFVRVVHHPSWVHHIPQRPFHSRQSAERDYPASQYSEGEGSSDHSEYSMATVQSAPLYPSLGSYRGFPMANASMWSSPGFRFHHSRKAPPNYDRLREVDRYFMNYQPHLRRAGSGTPRVRPAMNTAILPDTCHEDPCVYTQPVRFQTNVDTFSSEPVRTKKRLINRFSLFLSFF